MSILTFAKTHLKEIALLSTTIIVTTVTARSVVDIDEAEKLLEGEQPLEKLTRKLIGITLTSLGRAIMNASFINLDFRAQVGRQLCFVGLYIQDYKPRKDFN